MCSSFSYPTAYIDKQFRKVLGDCISSTSIIPVIENEYRFIQLRRKLMGQPTPRHSQLEAQIAQYKLDHDECVANQAMNVPSSIATTINEVKSVKTISSYTTLMKIGSYQ